MADESGGWSETDTAVYRSVARYAVPERERQIAIIASLVRAAKTEGAVLDLCCGEGLLTEAAMTALPGVAALAYDGSETMLAETAKRAPDRARLTTKRIDLASEDWRRFDVPLRAVVSSLAVHHLDAAQKRQLFADLRDAIAPGGVFVLADIMEAATDAGARISADMWDEETRRRALDIDGALDGFHAFEKASWNHFRQPSDDFDKPSGLTEHIDWLRSAGFADVDVHWMIAGHAIVSAWRK